MAQPEVDAKEPKVTPRGYRTLRWLLRLWFAIFFRKIRVLGAARLPVAGPALLAVSHPPSFLDALILAAAVERSISCLVPQRLLRSFFLRWMAAGLRMIPYEPEGLAWRSAVEVAGARLVEGEAVAIFAERVRGGPAARRPAGPSAQACAALALQAETRRNAARGFVILPVHLLLPVSRSQSGELLIHIDRAIAVKDYRERRDGAPALAGAVESAWQDNAFRLGLGELDAFLDDLEQLLRADLQEDWASRPDWRQQMEGFRLSGAVADWLRDVNTLNPGRLVALREALEEYCERARRCALGKFRTELAEWLGSRRRRGWVWLESALGFPVALYGLTNHLLVWCILSWLGLGPRNDGRNPRLSAGGWAVRVIVALGCYALQVLACAYFLGRAAAGYYAPTLPLGGAYAWRYGGLLRHRTHPAILSLLRPRRLEKLRKRRKELIEQLNRSLDAYAEVLGIPH